MTSEDRARRCIIASLLRAPIWIRAVSASLLAAARSLCSCPAPVHAIALHAAI